MSFLTQSHQVFFGRPLSNSFNFPRYTTFDPVIIIFMVVIIDDKDVHYIVGTKLTQQCKEIARYLINVRQVEFNLVQSNPLNVTTLNVTNRFMSQKFFSPASVHRN